MKITINATNLNSGAELKELKARNKVMVKNLKALNKQVTQLEKAKEGRAKSDSVLTATEELMAILKRSLDKLYQNSLNIRERMQYDVIPLYRATKEKMITRLKVMDTSDSSYKEMEEIVDKATRNQSYLQSSLERLNLNIKRLVQVRDKLLKSINIITLWKEVNYKSDELLKKLRQFNERIEELYDLLNPVES